MAAAPLSFFCPITYELMVDPGMYRPFAAATGIACPAYYTVTDGACLYCAAAVTTEDGHSYERAAIEFWLRDHNTSPKTGGRLRSTALIAAHALRNAIEEWQQANCKHIPRIALTVLEKEPWFVKDWTSMDT